MDAMLQSFQQSAANSIRKYADNANVARMIRDGFAYPYTIDHATSFIKRLIEAPKARVLARAICIGGMAVDSIALFVQDDVYRKTADLAYWLGEPFWGRRITTWTIRPICA